MYNQRLGAIETVAPCVGAWIETLLGFPDVFDGHVAPCVGAWIETVAIPKSTASCNVAPCVGAWIETGRSEEGRLDYPGRTLRGCVD